MASDCRRRVALIANEKGGVGKSVFTRALVDWLRTQGTRVLAFDADGSVGATIRVLGTRESGGQICKDQDPAVGIGFYNGRNDNERNILLDSIASNDPLYIHDLAGGLLGDLTKIVDDGDGLTGLLDAYAEHGCRVTVFHVVSPDIGSAQSVGRWLDLTGASVDHVAVVNLKHGKPPSDFPFWFGFRDAKGDNKGGGTRRRLLQEGGLEIEFPSLQSGTFAKLDAENIRFSQAQTVGMLTITEQAHVTKFQRDFAAMIAPALPLLGVEGA